MTLYRIDTRQTEPIDNQYFTTYHVWAESESAARDLFRRRLKHAVIQGITAVYGDEPLLLLSAGWNSDE